MVNKTTVKRGIRKADTAAKSTLNKAQQGRARLRDRAEDMVDNDDNLLRNTAENAGAYVGEKLEAGKVAAEQVTTEVEGRVRAHPLASIAAAFVGGLVVAGLLRR